MSVGAPPIDVSYPDQGHRVLAPLREGHFWFTYRRQMLLDVAARCLAGRASARVLEIGCGDGHVARELARRYRTVGVECRLDDLLAARGSDGLTLVMGDGSASLFSPRFDLVGLFDVIEHTSDDVGLLRSAASFAAAGGWVVLTVPADPRLWSKLDRCAGHYRRYTRRSVREAVESAGLEVRELVPVFRLLWPLARALAILQRGKEVEDPASEYRVARLWNWLLSKGLAVEGRLLGRSERGAGTSWLVVAQNRR